MLLNIIKKEIVWRKISIIMVRFVGIKKALKLIIDSFISEK